ncbi:hypothetical protein LWI29_005680 [Acer saccharum]|uniref:Reverse transcriptase domain-containing protein n=1 Tax=Acer saccharum TaxID=4024 RepID=A0AA39T1B7_ACESA|nr:hypothetical protein LWI29_005680 [Acer saccharum]
MVASDHFLPISSLRGFSAPTHLLYADDVLILCRGTTNNLRNVMKAFCVYGNISGQLVNWSKSSIFFRSSVSPTQISSLQSLVRMQIGHFLFSYLGVPLFRGKPRKSILMPIADKIVSKFARWKAPFSPNRHPVVLRSNWAHFGPPMHKFSLSSKKPNLHGHQASRSTSAALCPRSRVSKLAKKTAVSCGRKVSAVQDVQARGKGSEMPGDFRRRARTHEPGVLNPPEWPTLEIFSPKLA